LSRSSPPKIDYSPEAVFGRNGLKKVIDSLSKDQRETLRLYFFEGYTLSGNQREARSTPGEREAPLLPRALAKLRRADGWECCAGESNTMGNKGSNDRPGKWSQDDRTRSSSNFAPSRTTADLTFEEKKMLRDHLTGCADCRQALNDFEAAVDFACLCFIRDSPRANLWRRKHQSQKRLTRHRPVCQTPPLATRS